MPRTKLDKVRDPHERYRGLILGRMRTLGINNEELARKMNKSTPTIRSYIKDPGQMKLSTLARLNRILDIDAEAARAALCVK